MSLIKARWITVAAVAMGSATVLWITLRPVAVNVEPPTSIEAVDTNLADADAIDVAVSEDLFAETNSPNALALIGNAVSPEAPASAQPPRLVGIATGSRGKAIVLAVSASGETRMLKAGDDMDGWRVTSVSRSRAVFAQGDRQEKVGLDRSNKLGTGASSGGQQTSIDRAPQGEGRTSQ